MEQKLKIEQYGAHRHQTYRKPYRTEKVVIDLQYGFRQCISRETHLSFYTRTCTQQQQHTNRFHHYGPWQNLWQSPTPRTVLHVTILRTKSHTTNCVACLPVLLQDEDRQIRAVIWSCYSYINCAINLYLQDFIYSGSSFMYTKNKTGSINVLGDTWGKATSSSSKTGRQATDWWLHPVKRREGR
jgi:hypothetical protein